MTAGRLAGKVVVITGSTRGIGRAMAESCADAGATVVVSARTAADVEETVDALRSRGAEASGLACDVARDEDLSALLSHAVDAHGGVDVWVNNAGISLGMRRHVDVSPEEVRRIVAVNLTATMVASRMVVRYFTDRGSGVLVNVSGRGADGRSAAFTAAYAATKAGVMAFTRSLAEEARHDPVAILAFMPGMVDTDFYGASMEVGPGLDDLAGNIRIVLDAIGTPIGEVGPALVDAACVPPGARAVVWRAGNPGRRMVGGMKLALARITGRMKPM